jgi:hypothetical protein
MSSRLAVDPRRNIDFGEEWDTYYISGDPDGSREILDGLRGDLGSAHSRQVKARIPDSTGD